MGGDSGQVVVASLKVQTRSRQEGLHGLLLSQQECFRVGEATLADAEVGQGDVRMPTRRLHDRLKAGLGPNEQDLCFAPAA